MDLQKEREAFEQHLTDTGLVEFAGYGFAVDECDEYLHEPTQVAWDSWLIGLNRAKAQAIPEGFVVVPVEPKQETIKQMTKVWFESNCAHIMKTKTAELLYKAMIEAAQRESHD